MPLAQSDLDFLAVNLQNAGNNVMIGDPRMAGLFKETRHALVESKASLAWMRSLVGQWLLVLHESLQRGLQVEESAEIRAAKSFIGCHFADVVTLRQLADEVQMSEGWFSERFVREAGLTPIDYLNRVRCGEARNLLEKSTLSVGEIAFQVGFSSTQYFATAFKKYTGMTPSGYRRRSHDTKWDEVVLMSVDP
jgi:AraC-like DNA-binding protein